ncbi:MAG: hypothetical protein MUC40_05990 [Akkermansiaceae bacterium]|jgi:hypothetical protein|nr:hypothetical protein [Akkermansiaceae bacterium]
MNATVKSSFWTDERLEEAPPELKLAVLWLITNPARDLCGFTKVSNKRFTFETGLPASSLDGASKALPSSIKQLPGGIYFVTHFLRHQFGKGGLLNGKNKVLIAAARHAMGLPSPMLEAFKSAYPELFSTADSCPANDPPSKGDASHPEGVIAIAREGARAGEGEEHAEDARRLCEMHPQRNLSQPALRAAAAAIRKHGFALVAEGTRAYAAAVAAWTPAERLQFVRNAADFFGEEIWNQPATNWASRKTAATNGHHRPLHTGGRKPSGIMTFDEP